MRLLSLNNVCEAQRIDSAWIDSPRAREGYAISLWSKMITARLRSYSRPLELSLTQSRVSFLFWELFSKFLDLDIFNLIQGCD
jgi:hypothetical protein